MPRGYKENLKDKMNNVKNSVKLNLLEMTLKSSLAFKWVRFLGGFSV